MRNWLILTLACVAMATSGADCIDSIFDDKPQDAGLQRFASETELRDYLAEQYREQNRWTFSDLFIIDAAGPVADEGTTEQNDTDYSTTNVQEKGVDESDIVKNDGEYIYVLENKTIHVVQATPAESVQEIATVELAFPGESLYLSGDTLVALSSQFHWYLEADATRPGRAGESENGSAPGGDADVPVSAMVGDEWNDGGQVTVTVINVADPVNPTITAELDFEGSIATSRMIDNRLYLVMTTYPYIPAWITNANVDTMTVDEWLPDYRLILPDGSVKTEDIASWQDIWRPGIPNGYGLTTIATIDVANPAAEFESTVITADAGVTYASLNALYVTDTDYDWETDTSRTETLIHKIDFTEEGTNYVATGSVPGRPLNQYSLGEQNDNLRIATTVDTFSFTIGSSISNSVYVLSENGEALEVVGSIEDIAPGEEIYAARFVGDRGFLVTFERIDPLFTLDLSDPANPTIVGELKVPGYSDHIQMMDENHLLTIGKDAQDNGEFAWVQGVQLSIFDVTDPADPRLMHKEIIGTRGSNSEANYNPKAFNYFPAREALAFPIDLYTGDTTGPEYGTHEFTGLLVYRVTLENGFESLGRISTLEEGTDDCWRWWSGLTRGVFIGDYVYAVTDRDTQAALINDMSTIVGQAEFTGVEPGDYCGWPAEPGFEILPIAAEGLR